MLPVVIFVVSVAFNIAVRLAVPFIGKFRSGIDSMLFCAIATGFLGGPKSGLMYGFLVAVAYYALSGRHWDRAAFVIPMIALFGMLAGILSGMHISFLALGISIFFIYHAASFALFGLLLKNAGPGYAIFAILNFITTYGLLQIAAVYL